MNAEYVPLLIGWALIGLAGLLALTAIAMTAVLNARRVGPRRRGNP